MWRDIFLAMMLLLTVLSPPSSGQSLPVDCKGTVNLLPQSTVCANVPLTFEGTLPPQYADSADFRVDGIAHTIQQAAAYKVSISHTFTSTGAHTVTLFVRDTFGCTDTDTLQLTVIANPVPVITRTGDTLSIIVANADSVRWFLNDMRIPGADTTYLVTDSTGYYTATVYYNNRCSATSAVYTLNDNPCFTTSIISAIPAGLVADTICQNTSLTLSANTVAAYDSVAWSVNGAPVVNDSLVLAGYPFVQRIYVADSGVNTITLLVRDTNGCIMQDSLVLFARGNELPVFSHTGDTLRILNPAPRYQWIVNDSLNGGVTGPKISTPQSGLYIASAFSQDSFTVKTCIATANIYINLDPVCRTGALSVGDTAFCENEEVLLQVVLPSEYLVNTQLRLNGNVLAATPYDSTENLVSKMLNPLVAGQYQVTIAASDNNSCQFTDTISFTVLDVDTLVVSVLPDTLPAIDTLVATGATPDSLQWFLNGEAIIAANAYTYFTDTNGHFYVMGLFANGCIANAAPVEVRPDSCVAYVGGAQIDTVCQQTCIQLQAFAGQSPDTIRWFADTLLLAEKKYINAQSLLETICLTNSGAQQIILQVKHTNNCVATDTITVFAESNPQADILQVDDLQVSIISADTYNWYDNFSLAQSSPDSTFTICASTFVGLETEQANGCKSFDSQYAGFGDGCTIGALLAPDTVCQNTAVTIKSYLPENHYRATWDFGDGTIVVDSLFDKREFLLVEHTFLTQGVKSIKLQVQNCAGCVSEDSIRIFVEDNPLVNILQTGDTLSAAVTLIDSLYKWNLNGTPVLLANTPATVMNTSGYFSIDVTRDNGCRTTGAGYFYNAPCDFVDAHFTTGGSVFCQNDTVFLQASSTEDILYDWKLNNTSFAASKFPNTALQTAGANTITLITSESTATCADTFSRTVTVNALPPANAGSDFGVCVAGKGVLNASGGVSYRWTPATFLSNPNIANPQILLDSSVTYGTILTYTVTVTSADNCVAQDSVEINVGDVTFANISSDTIICFGESVQLLATGGVSYQWSPANLLDNASVNNPLASPVTNTTFTAVVADADNCRDTVSVEVNVFPQVPADAGPNVSICLGGSTQLGASGGVSYVWSPTSGLSANNIANPFAFPSSTTTYTVAVIDANSCTASDQVTVSIGGVLVPNAGPDVETCAGTNVQLQAFGGTTYTWNPATSLSNANISNPIFNGTATTQYILSVSDGVCTGNDTLLITVNQNPPQPVITRNGEVLTTFPGYVYQWYFNGNQISGANDISYTATQDGDYKVRITDTSGCVNISDDLNVILTGVEEILENSISIYPNPTDGRIFIKSAFNGLDEMTIRVYNMLGEMVLENQMTGSRHEVELIAFSKGLYLIQINKGAQSVSKKILLE